MSLKATWRFNYLWGNAVASAVIAPAPWGRCPAPSPRSTLPATPGITSPRCVFARARTAGIQLPLPAASTGNPLPRHSLAPGYLDQEGYTQHDRQHLGSIATALATTIACRGASIPSEPLEFYQEIGVRGVLVAVVEELQFRNQRPCGRPWATSSTAPCPADHRG